MWNALLAGAVFQHPSVETLRRELARNGQRREICGFPGKTPSAWAFSRFLHRLGNHVDAMNALFDELVETLRILLPQFGERLAIDSKAVPSFAKHRSKKETPDGRRDTDADYGVKSYRGVHKDGRPWETVKHGFGYLPSQTRDPPVPGLTTTDPEHLSQQVRGHGHFGLPSAHHVLNLRPR